MPTEDQELLNRISQLAGQINRRKNEMAGITAIPAPQHERYRRGVSGPYRGRGGARGARAAPYPNRTISSSSSSSNINNNNNNINTNDGEAFVARHERHMQLINRNIYAQDEQARAAAMEQTRRQKQQQADVHERHALRAHFSRATHASPHSAGTPYQVLVEGIPFLVVKGGSKLARLPGSTVAASATPKTAVVGGVKFYRSKHGNLYRHGVVQAQRRTGTVKKMDEPCKVFSTTGSCAKGPRCRYVHDAARVAACLSFLRTGDCGNGSECDLSHDLTSERTPHCVHHAKGYCSNEECVYVHASVPASAPVCRAFGLYGYCSDGAECTARHVLFECPDFSNTGVCKVRGCRLAHRERASFLRRRSGGADTASADTTADDDDASSDGESVGSDDVDSDEADEFVGADADADDFDVVNQADYIGLA